MHVGQVETTQRVFAQQDFDRFAALSGDDNPIHVDPEFSARTKFGWTVAHGMLLYSIVCGVIGTRLPGPGTVQLEQELMFPTATPAGEPVNIQVEVIGLNTDEGTAELRTDVAKSDGSMGLQGRTRVRLPGQPVAYSSSTPTRSETQRSNTSTLRGLAVGQRAETQRTFSAQDMAEYAALTGDANPVFTDAQHARRTGLGAPVVPGGLLGGLFSQLLGTRLPGKGTNYLKQWLEFTAPAHVDQQLTASVEIVRIRPEKQLVNLRTICANSSGEAVCRGEALVLVSDVTSRA